MTELQVCMEFMLYEFSFSIQSQNNLFGDKIIAVGENISRQFMLHEGVLHDLEFQQAMEHVGEQAMVH